MKVAVYYNNNDIRIEKRPQPVISEGEVLVRMEATGICGTDTMQWYRIKKAPRVLGHEMAGKIAAVGKGVENLKIGDRVFVSHHVPCYSCRHCTNGNHTACESLHAGNYDPGGFSELVRIPEQNVRYGTLILPDEVSFDDATMIEPLGCVIAGQKKAEIKKGQSVLIIGSGVSGLLHVQLAKSKGARVIASDINPYKLAKALEFGADHTINAVEFTIDRLKTLNEGQLADIVIVCTSSDQAVIDAVNSVERRGKILFFAVSDADILTPSARFWRNEISAMFSYGADPEDLREALNMIANTKINVHGMITHRLPLSQIQQGFGLASGKSSLKVVLVADNESENNH